MNIMYRLLLLFLILSPAAARAQDSTDGNAPGEADAAAAEQTPGGEGAVDATIKRYRQQIASLQAEYGAYAHGLNEALAGLGRAYSQNGNHKEAAAAFKSALYVTRVNDGLNSMAQLPFLDALIDQYDSLGRLGKVSDLYDYMYWVYKRNYGAGDLRTLPPIERMQQWMRKVYRRGGDLTMDQIQTLSNLNYKAILILEHNYGPLDPHLIDHLRQYSDANLYAAEQLRKQLLRHNIPTNLEQCGFIMLDADKSYSLYTKEYALMVEERCQNYDNGRRALQRILAINEKNNLPTESYARALTRLGDWEMIFDRQYSARDFYARAYDVLGKAGDGDKKIAELFGQPRILTATDALDAGRPADAADTTAGSKDSGQDTPYTVVSMDVTAAGSPRNIKVVESKPAQDTELQQQATQDLRRSIFRPRLENGKPVDTVGYTMTIRQED